MPAEKQKIFSFCPQCLGKKVVTVTRNIPGSDPLQLEVTEIECPRCEGEGHIESGYLLVPNP